MGAYDFCARRALAAAIAGILLVPGALLADDAVPTAPEPAPSTAPAVAPPGDRAPAVEQTKTQTQTQTQTAPPAPEVTAAKKEPRHKKKEPKVHAAGSGGVTIQNFAFSPATIDINAGDTVTWTNRDSAPHTATGNGGS